jgi:hypothetical protein
MSNKEDPIWIDNFQIIFNKPLEFFPTKIQSKEERLNAIVRLSLYTSVILSVYHSNIKYISIFLFVLFLTYIIHTNHPSTTITAVTSQQGTDKGIEKLEGDIKKADPLNCIRPTVDNPFMNATMKDYMNFDNNGNTIDRPPACDPNDPKIKGMIDDTFNNNLYKDVGDVFGKMNSQRNYYTMPSTTIPNDQEAFAKWLYLNPNTCKEDQDACRPFEDIRSNRFVLPNPNVNPTDSKKLQK